MRSCFFVWRTLENMVQIGRYGLEICKKIITKMVAMPGEMCYPNHETLSPKYNYAVSTG